jgi:26S proteasome regulatory subunit N6
MPDAMEVEPTTETTTTTTTTPSTVTVTVAVTAFASNSVEAEAEEEDVSELLALLESADDVKAVEAKIPILLSVIQNVEKTGTTAIQLKERAVYNLTRAYCDDAVQQYEQVVEFLTGETGRYFLAHITKAKTAKVVRQVLDIVVAAAPDQLDMQESIARSIIAWTETEKRTFLRQRVEARLASILFHQKKYAEALDLCDRLLAELKKLDDKQLLVETHLLESKIHFGLRNVPKAKAALTASRTAANAIYVSPQLQADIDSMSGTIHTEEADYNTAHSYFLEAFEQLDQMNQQEEAVQALKYMMLCRILDSLRAALHLSAGGTVGSVTSKAEVEISGMISGRQGVKYAGKDIDAMSAIANAAAHRNLKEFQEVLEKFSDELQQDLLIKHHLHILQEQLLESNLIRIIEPYSCVELQHIADKIEMPIPVVEKKLSQMILDGKFQGIIDQGKGQLVVYEESEKDMAMEKGLKVINNMDDVVSSLFERSKALRTMML